MSAQYINELNHAIVDANSAFECSGSINLDGPLTLFAEVPAAENGSAAIVSLKFPIVEPSEASLKPLLDVCIPASFGRGQDSVLDPSYRQALVLPTNVVALHAPKFNLASILEVVGDTLVKFGPRENKVVMARFDKLNVYGPGGFFKAHADTPRSKEMFASLVVALPCAHTGGELAVWNLLVVNRDKGDKEVDGHESDSAGGGNESDPSGGGNEGDLSGSDNESGSSGSGNESERPAEKNILEEYPPKIFSWGASKGISWAAFPSDRYHEVRPVTQGYRVTLTYNLFLDKRRQINLQTTATDDLSLQENIAIPDQLTVKHPIFDALVHFISSPECFPDGAEIGIHLVNRYVFTVDDRASSIIGNLRGSDFIVYRALVALHLKFTTHFVLFFEENFQWHEESEPVVLLHHRSTGQALSHDQGDDDGYEIASIVETWGAKLLSETGIQVINEPNHNVPFVHGTNGNEPCIEFTYGSVMFRVKIPAAKDRPSSIALEIATDASGF